MTVYILVFSGAASLVDGFGQHVYVTEDLAKRYQVAYNNIEVREGTWEVITRSLMNK